MTASAGVLDFFIVEASEYLERLDNLLTSAGPAGPNADAFGRYARALRGSATMSRQYGIADVAGALERIARALRNRAMGWTPAASAAVIAAVDDLRILVRAVREWGPADDRRAQARTAELDRMAPGPGGAIVPPAPPAADAPVSGAHFLAGETGDLARALEQLVAAPEDTGAVAALAGRVRALRGVADLKDMPPLPDVVDALERSLKSLELGAGAPGFTARQKSLFATAAAALRRASRDIAQRGRPVPGAPEELAFHNAMAALPDEGGAADRIVPIAQLFFDDAGPHLVNAAPNPPTTASERFRMEVVSLAEHLRSVVAEARTMRAPDARDHIGRELRGALRALGAAASSFGERQVARFAAEWSVKVATLNDAGLTALDRAATILADPETRPEQLARALEQLAAPRSPQVAARSTQALLATDESFATPAAQSPAVPAMPAAPAMPAPALEPPLSFAAPRRPSGPTTRRTPPSAPFVAPAAPIGAPLAAHPAAERRAPSPSTAWPAWPATPAAPAAPAAPAFAGAGAHASAPASGDQLRAFLQDGIAGLRRLEDQPLSAPAPMPDDDAVPIEQLLYRGRAALHRAAELRREWQAAGSAPSPEAMQELFDLLDLALVE
ncbi:MAG TPA: hypothetical protein VMT93_06065 [Gemmatimonadaceae bacterium]|nr:hypothetical protein [Gemmatimonadaceae bacterium]